MRLAVPFDTRHCQSVRGRESWFITNPNVHAKVTRPASATGNRMLVFSTRKVGNAPYEATAKFVVRLSPRPDTDRAPLESLKSRDRFLRAEVDLPTTDPVVRQTAQLAPNDAQTEFERLQWIFEYCSDIDSSGAQLSDDSKVALVTKHGSPKARARAMVTLCRALGFPALPRVVRCLVRRSCAVGLRGGAPGGCRKDRRVAALSDGPDPRAPRETG